MVLLFIADALDSLETLKSFIKIGRCKHIQKYVLDEDHRGLWFNMEYEADSLAVV